MIILIHFLGRIANTMLNVWNSILPRFRTRSKHVTGSVFLAGFWFHPVVSVASWLVFSPLPCRLMCAVCWLKLSATCSLSPIVLAQCHRAAWKPFVLAHGFRVFFFFVFFGKRWARNVNLRKWLNVRLILKVCVYIVKRHRARSDTCYRLNIFHFFFRRAPGEKNIEPVTRRWASNETLSPYAGLSA